MTPSFPVDGERKHSRMFELHRDIDESGVSGTGVVAWGIEFPDGVVALRWISEWPTSVVFHDRGMAAVEAVHGHGGKTRIVFQDTLRSTHTLAVEVVKAADELLDTANRFLNFEPRTALLDAFAPTFRCLFVHAPIAEALITAVHEYRAALTAHTEGGEGTP